ncbi:MAG: rhodanese-like domain-containing protein [Gemmatimonadaceae bacterium]
MDEQDYEQQVAEAKTRITEITAQEALALSAGGGDPVYLDVREPQEWNLFRIPGAVWVPLGDIDEMLAEQVPPGKKVIVYCARGNRSALAADSMLKQGYTDVTSLAGGITAWANAGGEVDSE